MKLLIIVLAMLATGAGALHSWYSKTLYIEAALLSEAHILTASVKKSVSDYFIEHGYLPNSNRVLGLSEASNVSGTSVTQVSIVPGGLVYVEFDREPGRRTLIFDPVVNPTNGHLFWRCVSSNIAKSVLNKVRPSCEAKPRESGASLMNAVRKNGSGELEGLLSLGSDINSRVDGITPLMLAVGQDNESMVVALLDAGADIDLLANRVDGLNALMIAISNGNARLMKLLLQRNASILAVDHYGRDAQWHAFKASERLDDAIFSGVISSHEYPRFVRLHDQSDPRPKELSKRVDTSLSTDIESIKTACVTDSEMALVAPNQCHQVLAQRPELTPEPNLERLKDTVRSLPESVLLAIASSLLNETARDEMPEDDLAELLTLSIVSNKPEFAGWLLKNANRLNGERDKNSVALIEASKRGYLSLINELIDRGADLDARDSQGGTALLGAVGRGQYAIAKALIRSGANPAVTDINGIDALLLARSKRNLRMTRLIKASTRRNLN